MYTPDYFKDVLKESIPVRLAARTFVIPVPKGCGSLMIYPHNVGDDPKMKQDMPILSKSGEVKGTGIAFVNYTDGAIQTARDDGNDTIMINGISEAQGAELTEYTKRIIPDPEKATEEGIREILRYAHEELNIDDIFDGEVSKIPEFEPQVLHPASSNCGVFIRRSSQERFALAGLGSGEYAGPASTPQVFNGAVVVVSNSKHAWMVQNQAFFETYRHPDDRPIRHAELPAFFMQEGQSPAPEAPQEWGECLRRLYKKRYEAEQAFVKRSGLTDRMDAIKILSDVRNQLATEMAAALGYDLQKVGTPHNLPWQVLVFGSTPNPKRDASLEGAEHVEDIFDQIIRGENNPRFVPWSQGTRERLTLPRDPAGKTLG